MQQLLRWHTEELRQGQQVGGAGVRRAGLPFADRLPADPQGLRHELLGHLAAGAVIPDGLPQAPGHLRLLLPDGTGFQVLPQGLNEQNRQINHQGQDARPDHQPQ